MKQRLHIAVLGSGRGSNFHAILHAVEEGKIPGALICLVISNNSTAGILDIARDHGLPAVHLSQKQFSGEEAFVGALLNMLREHGVNLIVLAGYMKHLHPRVIQAYRNRIINIHPALLPKHGGEGKYGIHVHESVIASGDRETGVTVHVVDEQYDHGPILGQTVLPVEPGDTPETLQQRVLAVEHRFYREVIGKIASGEITLG